jgi:GDPmannose 4,6-dehydratase
VTTSVRDFVRMAFENVGIEVEFKGHGIEEEAFVTKCNDSRYKLPIGKKVVGINPRYFRPAEVDLLIGDATKARTELGWKPKYDLAMLVKEMMEHEVVYQTKKLYNPES